MEEVFKEYSLTWTIKRDDLFCPIFVREFFLNYQATLENMCKLGEKATDIPTRETILVRVVMVDLSNSTIIRFLHGPNFTPLTTS